MLTRQAHSAADRTLAPSSSALTQLEGLGVQRTGLWPRGVDVELFHPSRIDHDLRAELAPNGETIVGYVGRLAQEKELHLLAPLAAPRRTRSCSSVAARRSASCGTCSRTRPSWACCRGRSSAPRTPPSTCSRTPAPTRRSARRSRRRSPPGSRSSRPLGRAAGPGRRRRHRVLLRARQRDDLASHVALLHNDPQLRLRMGRAARKSVAHKSWGAVNAALVDHYRDVIRGAPAAMTSRTSSSVSTRWTWPSIARPRARACRSGQTGSSSVQ